MKRLSLLALACLLTLAALIASPAPVFACTATLTCPDGTVISCSGPGTTGCVTAPGYVRCGRDIQVCR